jgi:mono/diheme cytochrome c family protein
MTPRHRPRGPARRRFEEELAKELRRQFERANAEGIPQRGRTSLLDGTQRLEETRKQVRPAARKALTRPDADLPQGLRELAPATREKAVTGIVAEFKAVVQLLVSRVRLAAQIGKVSDPVMAGPGRVDAFVTAKDILFGTADAPNSPVSFPHLWSIDATKWLHWDGNTNSVMERNMGQAIGLGAVFDAQGQSTLLPHNLHALESWARRLRAPKWPFDLDPQKAARGQTVFEDRCASCHGASPTSEDTALADIETDANRAVNFDSGVNGQPLHQALQNLLAKVKKQAYADAKPPIAPEQAKEFEAGRIPSVWRSRRAYANRTLVGVWATAPYLHNGSVPTLAQLLEIKPRPDTFPLGQRDYDVQLVGVPTQGSGTFTFDARTPGNRNSGHSGSRYGSDLPEAAKWALLEYLKTL